MRSPAVALPVGGEQRAVLEKLIRSQVAPHRDVQRAWVLLMAGDGFASTRIAEDVGVAAMTVKAWRDRFSEDGLKDFSSVRPGRGRKPSIPASKIEEIVDLTLRETPTAETHWSCRTMAARAGVSPATVQRIWSARGLAPHRLETFKLSNDPRFEEKLVDVVGLYLWSTGAENLTIEQRQQIIRLTVHEVLIGEDDVTIRHSIPTPTHDQPPSYLLRLGSREEPDPGVGSHPTVAADQAGPGGHDDS